MSKLTAGIIIIGDEILSGRTQDINANYIAQELIKVGINLMEIRVIQDNINIIKKTVYEVSQRLYLCFYYRRYWAYS